MTEISMPRFQYSLRTLLAAPVVVAIVCGLWVWWAKGERRRRLERVIRNSDVDQASREMLVRIVRANSDLTADLFPYMGLIFDFDSCEKHIPEACPKDAIERFFPFGFLPRVVWQRDLRLSDGSARCLVLFRSSYGDCVTLCLLDRSDCIVAWRIADGTIVSDVRLESSRGDLLIEFDVNLPGPNCDKCPHLRYRITSASVEELEDEKPSLGSGNAPVGEKLGSGGR
jgi:hypothetical protein